MKDEKNGRRPKWKKTKMEKDQKWKKTKMEDNQNLKTTKLKDDQNGRPPQWKTCLRLAQLIAACLKVISLI